MNTKTRTPAGGPGADSEAWVSAAGFDANSPSFRAAWQAADAEGEIT